ncbi:hypothetical protein C8R45DRAFT_305635 [Mycena sanguinolenta]|nr:hypothetical protein C8R45DRAFT_305635 [Mycena sanguinolenta]
MRSRHLSESYDHAVTAWMRLCRGSPHRAVPSEVEILFQLAVSFRADLPPTPTRTFDMISNCSRVELEPNHGDQRSALPILRDANLAPIFSASKSRASSRPSTGRPVAKTAVFVRQSEPPVRRRVDLKRLTDGTRPSYPLRPSTGEILVILHSTPKLG